MSIKIIVFVFITPLFLYSQNIRFEISDTLQFQKVENNTNYLLIAAGSIALTAILLSTDDQTYEIAQDILKQSSFVRNASPIITSLGDGKFSLGLFGSLGLFYFITGDKKSGDAALLGFESFLLSGISVQILKHTFGRERPSNRSIDGGIWHGPYLSQHGNPLASFDAFPSGHTATIFAAASTLSYVYPDGVVPYISYGVASLVAVSRVTESTHWFSDCFVGALVGYFSTKLIISLNDSESNINLGVINQDDLYALQITYTFK